MDANATPETPRRPLASVPPEPGDDAAAVRCAEQALQAMFGDAGIRRVLFVVPPDAEQSSFTYATGKRGRYWNYPPYGLGLIATRLAADGIAVEILNLNDAILGACRRSDGEDDFDYSGIIDAELKAKVDAFDPDIIGLTCMFSQTHPSTVDVSNRLRRIAADTPQAVGGVHVSNAFVGPTTRDDLIAAFPTIDFLFVYEAEIAFADFVRIVNGGQSAAGLAQVAFLGDDRVLYFTAQRRPQGEALDAIPDYRLMGMEGINDNGKIGGFYSLVEPGKRFATVLTNRGCRAQCTFCSVRNFNGVGVRGRSVSSVVDELLMLKNDYGIGHIMWLDDDLLYNSGRALELFNEMIRRDVAMTWDCTNGVLATSCTDELMRAAADSGCIGLNIGMESGNPETLKKIRKPGTVKNFLKAAEVLRGIERINARVFIMIGFPGETYRQIYDTINVAREMDLDWCNVFILQPLPNTPIFDQMVADGMIDDVDFGEVRFTTGAYGTLRKAAEKSAAPRDMLSIDFKDAFAGHSMDDIPGPAELDDIWAYMNFHLNFARLFRESREAKLVQQMKWLKNITDLIAPDNAFAKYFQGYLAYKLDGAIDEALIRDLEDCISRLPYWRDRLDDFDLSPDDLRSRTFPLKL